MFEQSMAAVRERRVTSFACSAMVQTAGVFGALLIPLLWIEPLPPLTLTLPPLLAPKAFKAVPVVAAQIGAPREMPRLTLRAVQPFVAPSRVPTGMPNMEDAPALLFVSGSNGVPGGLAVPGAFEGGPGIPVPEVNPPVEIRRETPPPAQAPVTVGGIVQAAKLMASPRPLYPPLARQARIEGVVLLSARIDAAGHVAGLKVESGHPLLVEAAVSAVRQWRYAPTLLNGRPVEVLTTIEVRFTLR